MMSRAKAQEFLTDALGIHFPYVSMGKIDSLDLFGYTELMILQLYKHNKDRWSFVADIGANLGLHSILMSRLGWSVVAYEPDPDISGRLVENLRANGCLTPGKRGSVSVIQMAVHTSSGMADFIRVHNNLTGSHLSGFKDSYGPRSTIQVETIDCRIIWPLCDFAKIDSEGNEAELAKTMTSDHMKKLSCVMEVRNEANAKTIFEHFQSIEVPIWTQKKDWQKAQSLDDMPKMNREGSIFVGHKDPWTTSS